METIEQQKSRHFEERIALIRDALVRCDWNMRDAARVLESRQSTLYTIVQRDAYLSKEYRRKNPGPGRPRLLPGEGTPAKKTNAG